MLCCAPKVLPKTVIVPGEDEVDEFLPAFKSLTSSANAGSPRSPYSQPIRPDVCGSYGKKDGGKSETARFLWWSSCRRVGKREKDEDRVLCAPEVSLYAVFDGHNRDLASRYCESNFKKILLQMILDVKSGKPQNTESYDGANAAGMDNETDVAARIGEIITNVSNQRKMSYNIANNRASRNISTSIEFEGDNNLNMDDVDGKTFVSSPTRHEMEVDNLLGEGDPEETRFNLRHNIKGRVITVPDHATAREALRRTFHALHAHGRKAIRQSGTTAVVIWFYRVPAEDENALHFIVANVGDSQCLYVAKPRNGVALQVKKLSFDHKGTNKSERERVEGAGGEFSRAGALQHALQVTRAIGDYQFEPYGLIPEPYISDAYPVEKAQSDAKFIGLFTDGVTDNYKREHLCEMIEKELKTTERAAIAPRVIELAWNSEGYKMRSDDMSCIILGFKPWSES